MADRLSITVAFEPGLLGLEDAARFCGVSLAHWKRLEAQNRIGPRPVHLGDRKLYSVQALRQWIGIGAPNRETYLRATDGK